MQDLRKSIFGALFGLALAVGLGVGATQLHASVTATSAKDCDTAQVCPTKAKDACPIEESAAKASSATSCPMGKSTTSI